MFRRAVPRRFAAGQLAQIAALTAIRSTLTEGSSGFVTTLRRRLAGLAMAFDRFCPDRHELAGATICLVRVAVTMYAPMLGTPMTCHRGDRTLDGRQAVTFTWRIHCR